MPAAYASGCNTEVRRQIQFNRGSACWVFTGRGNTFVGNFSKKQSIHVEMEAEQTLGPNVTGPGGFHAADVGTLDGGFGGGLVFTVPKSGRYVFSYSPCSMWSNQVKVRICASSK